MYARKYIYLFLLFYFVFWVFGLMLRVCNGLSNPELVEMAPESPDDLAKSTREMVALRCLEDMFDLGAGLNKDGVSDVENKTVFYLSLSCEDVLQHILQEVYISISFLGF